MGGRRPADPLFRQHWVFRLQPQTRTHMSTRHLDSLFQPKSVAVIGASGRAYSVGGTLWRNVRTGGFGGAIYPVNPKYKELDGRRCYARVDQLPEAPELAVICTPPATVVELMRQLAQRGTQAVVVITAGLSAEQKQAMLDIARPRLMRILGPNCVGLLAPHAGLNASFAHIPAARPGQLAFISQSGALVTAMLDWAEARDIGFSHFVSLGEHADVDFGDMLDYLANDPQTRAILLYIESIDDARKFMSAARSAARNKPVIAVKAGRSEQGSRAAASHTGALAGSDEVYDAAIARAGMLRVDSLEQLFLAAEILTRFRAPIGDRVTILTNGGGAGVMAADACAAQGVPLATLGELVVRELDTVLPANWSHDNPVDIIGDAPAQRYVDALQVLARHPQPTGTLLFIQAPTAIVPSADIARAMVPVVLPPGRPPLPLVACWIGGPAVAEARQIFVNAGIACYDMPEQAVAAIGMLQRYAQNQAQLTQAPPRRCGCGRPSPGRSPRASHRRASAGQRPRHADRARSQGRMRGLSHPRGGHPHRAGRRRSRRARGRAHRLSGGAQDPFGRHQPQVRRGGRGAEPAGRCRRSSRRHQHARSRAQSAPQGAIGGLYRAADGQAA